MNVKWYGTATVLLEQDGTRLLFDPFIPLNNKCFAPSIGELVAVPHILVTHGHLDHILHIPDIVRHGDGKTTVYCTATPKETLISKGVMEEQIHLIAPEDVLNMNPFDVRVLRGKHIAADKWLIIRTVFNPRILAHIGKLGYLAKENKICAEAGETVVYDISVSGKRILMMGSLNLDGDTDYPKEADLLIMPFQGRSDMTNYAMPFIERLRPKKVMLTHFDDTFPPISRAVNTEPFVSLMNQKCPGISVICPTAGTEIPLW